MIDKNTTCLILLPYTTTVDFKSVKVQKFSFNSRRLKVLFDMLRYCRQTEAVAKSTICYFSAVTPKGLKDQNRIISIIKKNNSN